MPTISAKDLREKTDQELEDQLRLEKKKLFDATVRGSSGEAIKPHEKREGKRLIARIQTLLRERALRRELTEQVGTLQGKEEGAQPKVKKLLRKGPRPHLPRTKLKNLRLSEISDADRAGVKLAEVQRRTEALKREDPGESK